MGGFFIDYLRWHYTTAFADMLHVAKNFFQAVFELFSIKLLLTTFFKPVFRIQETYAGGVDIEGFFTMLLTNTLMRLVGMIVRAVFVLLGLAILVFLFVLVVCAYILWIFVPFVGIAAPIFGIIFLIL